MALIKIIARFRCDGCNKEFECDRFDVAAPLINIPGLGLSVTTLCDIAMEQLRHNDAQIIGPSEQGDHDLCTNCTKYIDEVLPDSDLTYDQVCAALNERAGI